ncbi:cytochrome P450 [Amycolatopsis sp. NPDC004625]|uniref:cytochrome P450 n=1 Tax=Amycolatopsis sp. NPDC004625 TaxID=3154670 RepID=UPI0033B618B8
MRLNHGGSGRSALILAMAMGRPDAAEAQHHARLARDPDQLAALRADPARLPAAIEEMVRYDGAIELAISRFTTDEITVGDVTIPGGGEVVLLAIAAADRDPARFPAPDRFDTTRATSAHLGFGHGIHYCLGAPLARMEAAVALRTLLDRCADLTLAVHPGDGLSRRRTPHWTCSPSPG